ncbi:hypothetical protein C8Q77DRAFT_1140170 [Trametes polyzona]|nr:hypothetical protein C8Q77DRAFT_1140170 [Trametes polyzona]
MAISSLLLQPLLPGITSAHTQNLGTEPRLVTRTSKPGFFILSSANHPSRPRQQARVSRSAQPSAISPRMPGFENPPPFWQPRPKDPEEKRPPSSPPQSNSGHPSPWARGYQYRRHNEGSSEADWYPHKQKSYYKPHAYYSPTQDRRPRPEAGGAGPPPYAYPDAEGYYDYRRTREAFQNDHQDAPASAWSSPWDRYPYHPRGAYPGQRRGGGRGYGRGRGRGRGYAVDGRIQLGDDAPPGLGPRPSTEASPHDCQTLDPRAAQFMPGQDGVAKDQACSLKTTPTEASGEPASDVDLNLCVRLSPPRKVSVDRPTLDFVPGGEPDAEPRALWGNEEEKWAADAKEQEERRKWAGAAVADADRPLGVAEDGVVNGHDRTPRLTPGPTEPPGSSDVEAPQGAACTIHQGSSPSPTTLVSPTGQSELSLTPSKSTDVAPGDVKQIPAGGQVSSTPVTGTPNEPNDISSPQSGITALFGNTASPSAASIPALARGPSQEHERWFPSLFGSQSSRLAGLPTNPHSYRCAPVSEYESETNPSTPTTTARRLSMNGSRQSGLSEQLREARLDSLEARIEALEAQLRTLRLEVASFKRGDEGDGEFY